MEWKFREEIACAYCGEVIRDCGYFETEEGEFIHEMCKDDWLVLNMPKMRKVK